ncbi:hypothetical protein PG985_007841 [Apiospora marii]|uniref:uncharacterized protein n=1 Tax=Apiospora marii TaxID=335849 RepID=UPI00312E95AD
MVSYRLREQHHDHGDGGIRSPLLLRRHAPVDPPDALLLVGQVGVAITASGPSADVAASALEAPAGLKEQRGQETGVGQREGGASISAACW